MNFNKVISFLEGRLIQPLPGPEAHRRAIPRDRVSERLGHEQPTNPRLGGILILLFPDEDNQTIFPLIQRPDYPGTHGGQVSFPGGKYEDHDQSLVATALRETHAEIGVSPGTIKVIGTLTNIYIPPSNFQVTPVVGYLSNRPEFRRDPVEVDEILEVSLDQLMDRSLHKLIDVEVRGTRLPNTPYFDFHERVVWGATAMILSELHHILEGPATDS